MTMRKKAGLVSGVAACALVVGGVVLGQDLTRPEAAKIGRYIRMQGGLGVLDAASGALYYVDPSDATEIVTLDLPGCRAFVREAAKDMSGWGTVELPKVDPAVVPARGNTFVNSSPYEVLDTRTGAIYYLEAPPKSKVSEWKSVQVARVDPVLGTIARRELHVSKRGS
jgi:hypothetical protein